MERGANVPRSMVLFYQECNNFSLRNSSHLEGIIRLWNQETANDITQEKDGKQKEKETKGT